MGYSKTVDFESGPLAAMWNRAVEDGGLEVEIGDERISAATSLKSAQSYRYRLNGWRAAARAAKHPLASQFDLFVVKIVQIGNKIFLKLERDPVAESLASRFRTPKEMEEDAALAEREAKFAQMAAAQGLIAAPAEPARYEAQSDEGKDAQRRGAPESIIRSLDRAAELRVKGALGS